MRNLLKPSLIAAILVLAGCSTPYQEMGALGGVQATKITDSDAQIVASVNGYTDRTVAEQYALLKAAEYTIQNGFDYFEIVNASADANKQTNVYYNAYTGFQTYNTEKPRVDYRIRMYKGQFPRNAPGNTYDARSLVSNLGATVERPKESS